MSSRFVLLSAYGLCRFISDQLKTYQSLFLLKLTSAVDRRTKERRQNEIVSFLRFIYDPNCIEEKDDRYAKRYYKKAFYQALPK